MQNFLREYRWYLLWLAGLALLGWLSDFLGILWAIGWFLAGGPGTDSGYRKQREEESYRRQIEQRRRGWSAAH